MARVAERPIRLVVREDALERSRLTVLFRLLLAIPLIVWVALRGFAAYVVAFVLWLAILIEGQAPASLHDFVASYVRYATQVGAYVFLAADPYPWFRVQPDYPVDVEIDPPMRQSRWGGFFRLGLALPALLVAAVLGGAPATGRGVAVIAALLAWFATLARGRAPRGLRDVIAFALGYGAQAVGYLLLLTPRYPSSDPAHSEQYARLPEHPVRIVVADDLERPRLTVFFRLFLAIPHLVWITLWTFAVVFVVVVAWFAALVTGRVPAALRRFLTAYVRYATHLGAFLYLVGRRFPGFTGTPGSYGIDLELDAAERQGRWSVLFRLLLAIPAILLSSALDGVVLVVAFLSWWFALITRRMPEGLRNLGAACLRYSAQTSAYTLLVTDRYPYGAPVLRDSAPEPEEATPTLEPVPGDAF
jgi:hypothetical protein